MRIKTFKNQYPEKYQFRTEQARFDFLIESVLITIKKVQGGLLFWNGAFEREASEKGWIAVSLIRRNLMRNRKGEKFCNALSLLPDNADKEERFIELLEMMEKKHYFRLGGQFNKKYYLYRIGKKLEI